MHVYMHYYLSITFSHTNYVSSICVCINEKVASSHSICIHNQSPHIHPFPFSQNHKCVRTLSDKSNSPTHQRLPRANSNNNNSNGASAAGSGSSGGVVGLNATTTTAAESGIGSINSDSSLQPQQQPEPNQQQQDQQQQQQHATGLASSASGIVVIGVGVVGGGIVGVDVVPNSSNSNLSGSHNDSSVGSIVAIKQETMTSVDSLVAGSFVDSTTFLHSPNSQMINPNSMHSSGGGGGGGSGGSTTSSGAGGLSDAGVPGEPFACLMCPLPTKPEWSCWLSIRSL